MQLALAGVQTDWLPRAPRGSDSLLSCLTSGHDWSSWDHSADFCAPNTIRHMSQCCVHCDYAAHSDASAVKQRSISGVRGLRQRSALIWERLIWTLEALQVVNMWNWQNKSHITSATPDWALRTSEASLYIHKPRLKGYVHAETDIWNSLSSRLQTVLELRSIHLNTWSRQGPGLKRTKHINKAE